MIDLEKELERRKSRRERRVAVLLFVLFLIALFLQVFFTEKGGQGYGFQQSLLYFGLLYFNVLLIMILVFLVSRNVLRAYLAHRSGVLGGSLRWKLVSSLLGFSLIPSLILFVGSSYVLREGFDRWFGTQVFSALDDAQAITDVHYSGIESNLAFFSKRIGAKLETLRGNPDDPLLTEVLESYPIEAIEMYRSKLEAPLVARLSTLPSWAIPRAASQSLQRAFTGEEFRLIRQFGDGDLVQHFSSVMIKSPGTNDGLPGQSPPERWVYVLSYTVPLGLKSRMLDLRSSFLGYQKTRSLKAPLKANYSLILATLFLVVLFVVIWFGLYVAKSILAPVSELLRGTEAFRAGRWNYRIPTKDSSRALKSTSADLEVLKSAFNLMAEEVGQKSRQIEEANAQLISLVRELEERERYLENLLSSIRRGVVVLSPSGEIHRINSEALEFSSQIASANLSSSKQWMEKAAIGRLWREVFPELGMTEEIAEWLSEVKQLDGKPLDRIFELRRGLGRSSTLRAVRSTGIWIHDDRHQPIGWLVILEDVSDASRLEKLAAWQEVARRVAHEIKNPLTPIQISADRLQRRLIPNLTEGSDEYAISKECVGQIQKQVKVIRDLVREFSEFAKLPEPKLSPLNLKKLLSDFLQDYEFMHPECQFTFEDLRPAVSDGALVSADPEYMRRLFTNIADNALQSMLEARTSLPHLRIIMEDAENGGAQFLRIAFEDSGPGIPETMRERIFDPYVTSRSSGIGLGLAIVRRIAIEHLGRVRCEAGEGGRFVLELPQLSLENQRQHEDKNSHRR